MGETGVEEKTVALMTVAGAVTSAEVTAKAVREVADGGGGGRSGRGRRCWW